MLTTGYCNKPIISSYNILVNLRPIIQKLKWSQGYIVSLVISWF